ncbi:hypothetical protein [Natronoglycomyces albus]|nr:hypothetical protein [Natronoglycomyces albus]
MEQKDSSGQWAPLDQQVLRAPRDLLGPLAQLAQLDRSALKDLKDRSAQ